MTDDGERIVSGFFKMVDGQGIPLAIVLEHFHDRMLIPNWIDFVQDTIDHNWNLKSTLVKIDQSCFEVYGPEYRDIVMNNLKIWITNNW